MSGEPGPAGDFVERFQRWMLTAVTHRHGLDAGLEAAAPHLDGAGLTDVVLPSRRVASHRRLEIYADMYFHRLVSLLREDYPATTRCLGDAANDVFRDYLAAHPSTHQRLTPLGRHLPAWFRTRPGLPHHAFLADLSALEYAREVVFEGPASTPLSPDALSELPPETWGEQGLPLVAAHALLALQYPVHRYARAVRDGADEAIEVPDAEPTFLAVWRDGYAVEWEPVTPAAFALLQSLAGGGTLAHALEAALATGADLDTLAGALHGWFEGWATAGLFAAPTAPPATRDPAD